MGQYGDDFDTRSTPPSFIPASSRPRRTNPAAQNTHATGGSSAASASPDEPPRFSPAHTRRSTSSHSATGTPRSTGTSIHTPSAASSSRQPDDAGMNRTAIPRSFTPHHSPEQRRRSTEYSSSHVAPPRQRQSPSRDSAYSAIRNAAPSRPPSRSIPSSSVAAQSPRRRHHRLLIALIVLLAALALALFGTWNWVDSRLNKSAWLPGTAKTAGTSWLILGSDERDGTTGQDGTSGARTDTILVLTKPNSGPSSLISIPRDSLVTVNGTYMKINAVYQLSRAELVRQIESITGEHIDHVAEVQFGGLKSVVDALGGVQLCYDHTVDDKNSGMKWQAGCHIANGDMALAFSRMRYSDPNGDFGRATRQRQVIAAIMSKAVSTSTLTNFGKVKFTASSALAAVKVDDQTTPYTLVTMALAFRGATGGKGVTGSVYWTDPGYYVDGVGSTVLLDEAKNHELFTELANGTHKAGTVGTLAQSSN